MAQMKFDPLDASLVITGLASAFMLVGIAEFNLFDVGFSEPLTEIAGYSLSTAWVLGYASIVGVIITNENTSFQNLSDDIQGLQGYYLASAVAALGLPIAFIVLPQTVGDFFQSSDLWGLLYVVVVTSGQTALGWML